MAVEPGWSRPGVCVLARVARELLWPEQRVRFLRGEWEGKTGIVQAVPASGKVHVRIVGAASRLTDVDPDDLAVDEIAIDPTPSGGDAGPNIWTVAPGIAIDATNEGFRDFVVANLRIIASTRTGKAILAQFGVGDRALREVKQGSGGYAGYALVITEATFMKPRFGAPKYPEIETKTVKGYEAGRRIVTGATSTHIPLTVLMGPPDGPDAKFVGNPNAGLADERVEVRATGVYNHRDFPGATQPFDVVLFHELMHAYMRQLGVSNRLADREDRISAVLGERGIKAPTGKADDTVEEMLVVGLMGGKAMPVTENAYRSERRLSDDVSYPPRTSYKSVGLDDPDAETFGFERVQYTPEEDYAALRAGSDATDLTNARIYRTLLAIGLSEEDARYVAPL